MSDTSSGPKGKARWSDPATSHEAADHSVNRLEWEFLEALRKYPRGLTTTEIGRVWHKSRDWYSPRSVGLEKRGLVERIGKQPCKNSQGNMQNMIVFRLTRPAWLKDMMIND